MENGHFRMMSFLREMGQKDIITRWGGRHQVCGSGKWITRERHMQMFSFLRGRKSYSGSHNVLPLFDQKKVLATYLVSSRDLRHLEGVVVYGPGSA